MRIFPTPIPASTSRQPRDHSSLLRPSQTRRSPTRDALDRASPDAEGPCHFQDADTLRKPFAPSAPGMVTCCAPTVADQAAAARARCSAAPLPTMAIPFLTTSPPSPISPLRGQPIGQHAGDGRRLRSRSGKARGWWREIGQRARPPTEAALPRSLQPGTGLLTH